MLQIIINKFLSLDPGLQRYLIQLECKHLSFVCTDFISQKIYCCFENGQAIFSSSAPEHIDVTITGTLQDFLRYTITKKSYGLTIAGDATIAALIEKLYSQLNIDWEEELSKLTGDVIAHQAIYIIRQLKQYESTTRNSLAGMITEYLQEESKLLPTHYEVDDFMQEVDELRLRVDRLEARIKTYESN